MKDNNYCIKNNYLPLPTIINDPSINRIIAIGDVHGDMKLIIHYLEVLSKVIKRLSLNTTDNNTISVMVDNKEHKYKWIGKNTHIVQIGDQVDSYRPGREIKKDFADDINILQFFTKLNALAKKDGGGVYSLLGNHEFMNILGDFKYVSPENINMFEKYKDPSGKVFDSAIEARKHSFANGNEYANFLACTRHSVLIINDFLFIHGGIEKKFLETYQGRYKLSKLNKIVQKWLLNKLDEYKFDETTREIMNNNGPFWTRIMGQLSPYLSKNKIKCKSVLDPVLEAYKIKGMVIGHTPQLNDGINSTCDNKLFRIDVGASYAFDTDIINKNREPQVLEILKLPRFTQNKEDEDIYKYTVIFSKNESYNSTVIGNIVGFRKLEANINN